MVIVKPSSGPSLEEYHKAGLRVAILAKRPKAVVLRHEDQFTSGVPDMSVTCEFMTRWFEVKTAYDRPPRGRGLQKVTCVQLANQGCCWYIIYAEKHGERKTQIVAPKVILANEWSFENGATYECSGHNHQFVVDQFWK